uniref:Uncharacterized protein n=1 Tax=Megaviridae environmental sample TaxID=1737588 RepID=A0A5J6VIT3_9VIRU|nr:MAG: hypothetical protein [Megaviridae environmental sample]
MDFKGPAPNCIRELLPIDDYLFCEHREGDWETVIIAEISRRHPKWTSSECSAFARLLWRNNRHNICKLGQIFIKKHE